MDEVFNKHVLDEVSDDIFHTKFLTEKFTVVICDMLKESVLWKKGSYDNFYHTYDIPFEKHYPDLYDLIKTRFDTLILKTMGEIWTFGHKPSAANIFAVKYAEDTQLALEEHIDESYISGSIKLNNDYDGGLLTFPRQKYTNKELEIGDLIAWPSQITHPHFSTEVTKGEKYSITIWTDVKNNS